MDIKEKIIQLRKLVKENGATEAESLAAFELANKLMDKYGISEEDLAKISIEKDMKSTRYSTNTKVVDPAIQLCGVKIAEFCEVEAWTMSGDLMIFGLYGDVDMAEFLFDMIVRSMKKSWSDYLKAGDYNKRISRHDLYWSFRHGFAARVCEKLQELISLRNSGISNGKDLITRKMDLIKSSRDLMFNLSLSSGKAKASKVYTSVYEEGKRAGDKINLNRPVDARENETKYLK